MWKVVKENLLKQLGRRKRGEIGRCSGRVEGGTGETPSAKKPRERQGESLLTLRKIQKKRMPKLLKRGSWRRGPGGKRGGGGKDWGFWKNGWEKGGRKAKDRAPRGGKKTGEKGPGGMISGGKFR